MIGITSYGAYIPVYRLSRDLMGKAWQIPSLPGERSVAAGDEDSLTMAVEASMDCICDIDPKVIDGLFFATTTSPYKEKQCATVIATALDLRPDIITADYTGSLRAGTIALRAAGDAIKSKSAKSILIVAADCRLAEPESMLEQVFGDGAAALLVGEENVIAEILGFYSVADEFTGPWRTDDDRYVKFFEIKLDTQYGYMKNIAEAVQGLLKKYSMSAADFSKIVFYTPDPRSSTSLAKKFGIDFTKLQDPLFFTVGNTGTPLSLMMLISALEEAKAGDKILLGSYGDGSDVFSLQTTDKIADIKKNRRGIRVNLQSKRNLSSYEQYVRFRRLLERDRFNPKSSTVTYWRDRDQILRLYGMKCNKCGMVQYPISRICFKCQAKDDYEEVKLAKTGKVFTFTLDHLVGGDYLENPVPRVSIELDGGGRIFLEMTDCESKEVKVDMPVELTFRCVHEGAGFHNYYWKCRPLRGGDGNG